MHDPAKGNLHWEKESERFTQTLSQQCWCWRQMASMMEWHLSPRDQPSTSSEDTEVTISIVPKGISLLGHSAPGLYVLKRRRFP